MRPSDRLLKFFVFDHLPEGIMRTTASCCSILAEKLGELLPEGPEKTTGMRKLLEAKDCFVRAALEVERGEADPE